MMNLINGELIIDIPNSECSIKNSIVKKELKNSVGEFYISTNVVEYEKIISFLGMKEKSLIDVYFDVDKLDEYIELVQDRLLPYEYIFKEKLDYFFESIGLLKNEDGYTKEYISLVLSKFDENKGLHKYLNLPKQLKENIVNKAFYGIILGDITNLKIYKKDEKLFIYPYFKENYLSVIEENTGHDTPNVSSIKKLPMISKVEKPNFIKSHIKQNRVNGEDKNNYIEIAVVRTSLGEWGEKLVIEYEQSNLSKDNKSKVENVSKNGLHYDIVSFDEKTGREKHIEVKCTSKGINEPFYISRSEYEYLRKKEEGIVKQIYRVYNARQKNPKFYIIDCNEIDQYLNFKPISYEVSTINEET